MQIWLHEQQLWQGQRRAMNEGKEQSQSQENIHAAATPQACAEMGNRYKWKLKRVRPTRDPILKVDCIFEGEQTSFEDNRYD